MGKRLIKQFLYGIFYLAVAAGIGYGIYAVVLKPAPNCFDGSQNGGETGVDCGGNCVSCEIKNLQPLSSGEALLFSANRIFSVSAEIQNPNHSYGAKSFDYEVVFYDVSGKILNSVKNKSFIYAGELKNIIEPGVRITVGIPARAEIRLDGKSVVWKKAAEFNPPPSELKNVSAVLEGEQAVISGDIANPANYNFSLAVISAFLIDKLGVKIGVSKVELQNIGPLRAENFKIFISVRKDLLNSVNLKATAESASAEILK